MKKKKCDGRWMIIYDDKDKEEEFDNLILDIAQKNLDREYNRFKDIDNKAIGIIGVAGVLLTFISRPTSSDICVLSKDVIYMFTLSSFSITIILGLYTVMIRKYIHLPTDNIIKGAIYDKKYKKTLIGTYKKSENKLTEEANKKACILKCSIFMLGLSIILSIIYNVRWKYGSWKEEWKRIR